MWKHSDRGAVYYDLEIMYSFCVNILIRKVSFLRSAADIGVCQSKLPESYGNRFGGSACSKDKGIPVGCIQKWGNALLETDDVAIMANKFEVPFGCASAMVSGT